MQDWVITIPKTVKWEDYEKEIEAVKDGSQTMWYRVPGAPSVAKGDRMFVVWNGFVRGWMNVTGTKLRPSFICSTTGKEWKEGWYVGRSGEFHRIDPIPMKGFQGYRRMYLTDDLIQDEVTKLWRFE